jgi:hypothetical protein
MAAVPTHKAELLETKRMAGVSEGQWEKFQQAFGGSFGIFSLTQDPTHVLMWSHYASEHRGIVVEFDENNRWFDRKFAHNDQFRHLVRVTYVDNQRPRTWKQVNSTLPYTKMAQWRYEQEWRIIRPLSEGAEVSPGIFCFDVPPSAIRSIILGCRIDPGLENEIRASFAANQALSHVRFKRAKRSAANIEVIDADS